MPTLEAGVTLMPVPKLLDEAATRLEVAQARIEAARAAPRTTENLGDWLDALTEYAEALSDVHRFTNESVHEKLHELSRELKVEGYPWGPDADSPAAD